MAIAARIGDQLDRNLLFFEELGMEVICPEALKAISASKPSGLKYLDNTPRLIHICCLSRCIWVECVHQYIIDLRAYC